MSDNETKKPDSPGAGPPGPPSREQIEVRLVALLLGEASDFESAELGRAMEEDATLKAFYKKMEHALTVAREALCEDADVAASGEARPVLSPHRRQKVLETIGTPEPNKVVRWLRWPRRRAASKRPDTQALAEPHGEDAPEGAAAPAAATPPPDVAGRQERRSWMGLAVAACTTFVLISISMSIPAFNKVRTAAAPEAAAGGSGMEADADARQTQEKRLSALSQERSAVENQKRAEQEPYFKLQEVAQANRQAAEKRPAPSTRPAPAELPARGRTRGEPAEDRFPLKQLAIDGLAAAPDPAGDDDYDGDGAVEVAGRAWGLGFFGTPGLKSADGKTVESLDYDGDADTDVTALAAASERSSGWAAWTDKQDVEGAALAVPTEEAPVTRRLSLDLGGAVAAGSPEPGVDTQPAGVLLSLSAQLSDAGGAAVDERPVAAAIPVDLADPTGSPEPDSNLAVRENAAGWMRLAEAGEPAVETRGKALNQLEMKLAANEDLRADVDLELQERVREQEVQLSRMQRDERAIELLAKQITTVTAAEEVPQALEERLAVTASRTSPQPVIAGGDSAPGADARGIAVADSGEVADSDEVAAGLAGGGIVAVNGFFNYSGTAAKGEEGQANIADPAKEIPGEFGLPSAGAVRAGSAPSSDFGADNADLFLAATAGDITSVGGGAAGTASPVGGLPRRGSTVAPSDAPPVDAPEQSWAYRPKTEPAAPELGLVDRSAESKTDAGAADGFIGGTPPPAPSAGPAPVTATAAAAPTATAGFGGLLSISGTAEDEAPVAGFDDVSPGEITASGKDDSLKLGDLRDREGRPGSTTTAEVRDLVADSGRPFSDHRWTEEATPIQGQAGGAKYSEAGGERDGQSGLLFDFVDPGQLQVRGRGQGQGQGQGQNRAFSTTTTAGNITFSAEEGGAVLDDLQSRAAQPPAVTSAPKAAAPEAEAPVQALMLMDAEASGLDVLAEAERQGLARQHEPARPDESEAVRRRFEGEAQGRADRESSDRFRALNENRPEQAQLAAQGESARQRAADIASYELAYRQGGQQAAAEAAPETFSLEIRSGDGRESNRRASREKAQVRRRPVAPPGSGAAPAPVSRSRAALMGEAVELEAEEEAETAGAEASFKANRGTGLAVGGRGGALNSPVPVQTESETKAKALGRKMSRELLLASDGEPTEADEPVAAGEIEELERFAKSRSARSTVTPKQSEDRLKYLTPTARETPPPPATPAPAKPKPSAPATAPAPAADPAPLPAIKEKKEMEALKAARPAPEKAKASVDEPLDAPSPPAARRPPADPLPEIATAEKPVSTFSLNVSDVSFKTAAGHLSQGRLPPPGDIRSEEFVNAFNYHDPAPAHGAPIAFHWEIARSPFAHGRDLLRFSVQTAASGRERGRPLNLVLALDGSGSMAREDRLATVQAAIKVLAAQLQPADTVSVLSFARTARLHLDGHSGADRGPLLRTAGELNPQGGTHLEGGINLAYEIAQKHFRPGANNRVILMTDGAANLGDVLPESLRRRVEDARRRGVALDCFGVGLEDYNDTMLEALSRNGDGRYGFLDGVADVEDNFARQLVGALQVAASDVKVQVHFNPKRVKAYRQIGYRQHQLKKEDFFDNSVDAAEIGAAESGNALYAIAADPAGSGPYATVRVRFKVPATGKYELLVYDLDYRREVPPLDLANPATRLAAASAAFAEWLAQNPHAGQVSSGDLLAILQGVPETFAPDPRPAQLVNLIRQAAAVSPF